MGQLLALPASSCLFESLPLPHRIPKPTDEQRPQLEQMGIKITDEDTEFVSYTLPADWRMVDDSKNEACFYYIVNDSNMKVVEIKGLWNDISQMLILDVLKGDQIVPYAPKEKTTKRGKATYQGL
jgi:hypothetical protein